MGPQRWLLTATSAGKYLTVQKGSQENKVTIGVEPAGKCLLVKGQLSQQIDLQDQFNLILYLSRKKAAILRVLQFYLHPLGALKKNSICIK